MVSPVPGMIALTIAAIGDQQQRVRSGRCRGAS
jgi:hypothetical protein